MGPGQALAPGALAPGIEPAGSAALCPRELDPLERDYLRLNPLENPRWITQSRFKAVSTSGASLWCCGCHEGICGRCWRLSEVFQREVRGLVPPQGCWCWGEGLWTALSLFTIGTKKPGEEEVIQGGVVAGARFRIPVQNLAGARGNGLVERDLLAPRPSGGPQVFSLELSARRSQHPEPSSLVVRAGGCLKKNFYFSQTGYLATGVTFFTVPVLIISYLYESILEQNHSSSHSKKPTTNDYWGY